MTTAKTPAQRQASRKARLQAAGLVQVSRWVHKDDAPTLRAFADALVAVREHYNKGKK